MTTARAEVARGSGKGWRELVLRDRCWRTRSGDATGNMSARPADMAQADLIESDVGWGLGGRSTETERMRDQAVPVCG